MPEGQPFASACSMITEASEVTVSLLTRPLACPVSTAARASTIWLNCPDVTSSVRSLVISEVYNPCHSVFALNAVTSQ